MSDGSDASLEMAEGLALFLAAAHDLGKASPSFQCKIIPSNLDIQEECRQRLTGSGLELNLNLSQSHSPKHAIISEMILERNGIDRTVGVVLGGHHGKPPGFADLENLNAYSGHTGSKSKSWVEVQDELLDFACQLSSFDIGMVRQIRLDLQSQAVLTGLVIMSDWMASDETLFPYSEDGIGQSTSERIRDAWSSTGIWRWDAEDEWSSYDLYEGRFGFTARLFQKAVADVAANVSGPCMMVIEAPMGEGKTEAALVAAETLASRFGDGGVVFALPTQATADGIFKRFLDWAEKASPGFDHHSIFLAHGKSRFNDEFNRLRSSNMRVGDEDGGLVSGNIVAMDWFSGRKKGLLSDFVVGTVDQVLMAGLKQRHLALRHLALSGKVVVIDSLCASLGQGMLVYLAGREKAKGKSLDEVADYVRETIPHQCHWFTVDDLNHLKRGGRISAATALVGTMLSIKPVLHVDDAGHLISVGKARGRKASLLALVDHMEKTAENPGDQTIFISHGDCLEDAEFVADEVRRRFGVKTVHINYVGPVIGNHSGPGTLALFFLGSPR